jgi:hypothetical protein
MRTSSPSVTVHASRNPVDDLREGWDLHVGFGLEHPHLYAAMYSSPDPSREPAAVVRPALIVDEMVERVAKAGRLRTGFGWPPA